MKRLFAAIALFLTIAFTLPLTAGPPAKEALIEDARRLPVIMYHSVLKDPARAGKYVVSPETLKSDLVYLRSLGYESVLPKELIAFCEGTGTLPPKPVLITFDDGHLNSLTYVLPILEELGMCALVSVVGEYTDQFTEHPDPNPAYAYLSWDEICLLSASGRVEIGNHTYGMHSESPRAGCMRRFSETEEDYRAALSADVLRLNGRLSERGVDCRAFAYPFGRISPEADGILKDLGFKLTLTCYEHMNVIERGDGAALLSLGRFNRPSGENSATFFARVLKDA